MGATRKFGRGHIKKGLGFEMLWNSTAEAPLLSREGKAGRVEESGYCTMCLSIALRISKSTKKTNWRILLNSDLDLKISVLSGKKLSNILGKNIPICHLSKLEILWVKDLLKASAKLEIWHTSKLGHAQKKPQNNLFSRGLLHSENICINISIVS